MAHTVTAIDRTEVLEHGGYELNITGTFERGHTYRVYIGPTGTVTDEQAHSGVAGQKTVIIPYSLVQLRVYTPRVAPGVIHDVLVEDIATLGTDVVAASLTGRARDYGSKVFKIRKLYPPFYRSGPRSIESVS